MGLVRSLAKKVVGRVLGKGEADSPAPQAQPQRAAPTPAPRTASTLEMPVADGESLANIECGAQELKERLGAGEPVITIDVREPAETSGGIIPGALLIPLGQLAARWEVVKDANEVVCYCAGGGRSLQAATFLREKGIFNATSMEGGMFAWRAAGGPVTKPEGN